MTKDRAVALAFQALISSRPGLWILWKLPTPAPSLEIPAGFPQLPQAPQPLRRRL